MSKRPHTIAFRLDGEELAALEGIRKPNQRMSDLVRDIIKERTNGKNQSPSGEARP